MVYVVTSRFGVRAFRSLSAALERASVWGECQIKAVRIRRR